MSTKQNTLHKIALFCGAAFLAMSVASPSLAKSPYYFVDDNANKRSLYDKPDCNSVEDSCVGFGDYCNIRFYSSRYALGKGKAQWKYKGYIHIRINSGDYHVICKLEK
jgi:hypothetical protein